MILLTKVTPKRADPHLRTPIITLLNMQLRNRRSPQEIDPALMAGSLRFSVHPAASDRFPSILSRPLVVDKNASDKQGYPLSVSVFSLIPEHQGSDYLMLLLMLIITINSLTISAGMLSKLKSKSSCLNRFLLASTFLSNKHVSPDPLHKHSILASLGS